ncbi:MAG: type II toxin-antitoxin system VapC family toxin [Cyclobacteriaceae bacterium]
MSGDKLFLDTNIIIYFLSGDKTIADLIDQKTIYVSFVTQLELLSYHEISEEEQERVSDFLSDCVVIDINAAIKKSVIDLRKTYRLKLPDSIIIASALHLDLPVVSSDKAFSKIAELETVYYEK